MRNSVISPAHSIIQSNLFPPPSFPAAAGTVRPATGNKEGGRETERKRDGETGREENGSIYQDSDIFAFSGESHYEYQYEPRERKHSFLSFSLGYSCTKGIYSSQSNGQSVRLCMAV